MKKLFVSVAAIALTAASLVPKSALAGQPNLQYVGDAESGDQYLLDYNSLRRNGVIVQYNYLIRYNSTHYDNQNRPLVGLLTVTRGNCLTGQYQFTGGATYAPGWVVTQFHDTPSPIMQVRRDTMGAMVLSVACQATN